MLEKFYDQLSPETNAERIVGLAKRPARKTKTKSNTAESDAATS